MSQTGNTLNFEETILRKYQLDANELYTYPAHQIVKALSTCPSASEVRVVDAPKTGGASFTFDTFFDKTQFLSTVLKFYYTLPFKIKLVDGVWPLVAPGGAKKTIDENNFLSEILLDNNDICYAQQAMSQVFNTASLSLNGSSFANVDNIAPLSAITSPYYAVQDVNEYLQASQPDRFQDFNKYNGTAQQTLKFINPLGQIAQTTISPENEQNIFASKYQSGYSTRTPQWIFLGADPSSNTITVKCTFWNYLQFSIGSTPNDENVLSGINRLGFSAYLNTNNLGGHLFNIKQTAGVYRYESITQDTSNSDNTSAKMIVKLYSPPQYMREMMFEKGSDRMLPYQIGYPRIECQKYDTYHLAGGSAVSTSFVKTGIQLSSVPRSIYIALLRDRDTDPLTTPVCFGLIQNLSIGFGGVTTTFPDQLSLDYLTNSNGYDEMDPLGKLIKGYPIKINLGKDITLPRDLVVGTTGSYNFTVSGNFYNPSDSLDVSTFRLYIVPVYEDALSFDGSMFSRTSGVHVPIELLNEQYFLRDLFHASQNEIQVIGGGKFTDALKWVGRNAAKLVKNAWANRDKIASTIGDVAGVVKAIKGGKIQGNNTSGAGPNGTNTMGAGNVKSRVFK